MRLLICIFAFTLLTACSKKDPYLENPELAKTTLEKCHTDLRAAQKANDKAKISALTNDKDCAQAATAHAKHVNEGAIELLVLETPEVKKPASNTEPLRKGSTNPQDYLDMSFEEFYQWSKRCISSIVDRRTKQCEVVRSVTEQRYEVEIAKIREHYQGKTEELESFSKSVCIGEKAVDYLCEFSLKILQEHKQAKQ